MKQCNNLNRVMESKNHSKNKINPKIRISKKLKMAVMTLFAVFILTVIPQDISAQYYKSWLKTNEALGRFELYGDNDTKANELFQQAIAGFRKGTKKGAIVSEAAYNNLGVIYQALGDYDEALNCFYASEKICSEKLSQKNLQVENLNKVPMDAEWRNSQFNRYNESLTLAYTGLGNVYLLKRDFALAYQYYKLAGNKAGMAYFHLFGIDTEQNLPVAMSLFRESAIETGADFWSNVYWLDYQINEYNKGNYNDKAFVLFKDYFYLKSMNKYKKDVWLPALIQSADLDYPPAQCDLWRQYRDRKEFDKGLPYLQKAVDNNYVPAFYEMACMYHFGWGDTKIDYQEAVKWYEKAAIEGDPMAQNNLGWLYHQRNIAAPSGYSNSDMAYYWYNESAKQGIEKAKQNLVNLQMPKQNIFELIGQTLNSIANITNSAFETYNKLNKSKIQPYTPPSSSTVNSTASNKSSSSDKPCNCGYKEATVYNNSYNADRNRLMDMNTWRERYNDNDRKRYQADMKRTREEFNSRCCNLSPISKDDWEDWDGKKR